MTPKDTDPSQDNELLARYRRASDTDATRPSDAARDAIFAEARRVADELKKKGAPGRLDLQQPAANDSRWKITAFGTLGAALFAALLIAPRYWDTLPASKTSSASAPAPAAPTIAPPSPETQAQLASESAPAPVSAPSSNALQEVVVTAADRKRSRMQAELAAKPSSETKTYASSNDTNSIPYDALAQNASGAAAARSAGARAAQASDAAPIAAPAAPTALTASTAARLSNAQTAALSGRAANVDVRDAQGRTALLIAVAEGKLDVVRSLLKEGADPNLADSAGTTPLRLATDKKFEDIAALLRDAGAR